MYDMMFWVNISVSFDSFRYIFFLIRCLFEDTHVKLKVNRNQFQNVFETITTISDTRPIII